MFHIVLFEPEIPPNTGNIIRLCANTGCQLHLIRPLGFEFDDRKLRRAGLDYHEWANVCIHDDFEMFMNTVDFNRLWLFSTKGKKSYSSIDYHDGDALLFGPETRGLPDALLSVERQQVLRLPMLDTSRSLNLSNTVAVVVYEAWRQAGFAGSEIVNEKHA
ncbi:MAG: tRNA (uridine(34)/cytosine(34)/5-carboxymethylaminomethyluridine(34)-2'-O)-methyltransferase TrmL [Gammaproteobacteria bacterium]